MPNYTKYRNMGRCSCAGWGLMQGGEPVYDHYEMIDSDGFTSVVHILKSTLPANVEADLDTAMGVIKTKNPVKTKL